MSVNSHVQIPISIIKSFGHPEKVVNEDGMINTSNFVYCLRQGGDAIQSESIRDYGSQLGYFTDEIEAMLNHEYETPLGQTKKKIIDFAKGKVKTIDITHDDYLVLKSYLRMLFYRNEHFFDIYKKESLFAKIGIEDQPSDYVSMCYELNINPIPNYDLYMIALLKATEKKNFINNYCGFSYVTGISEITKEVSFIVPLNPKCCILFFVPKSCREEDYFIGQLFANDEEVKHINQFIARTERMFTNNSLISLTKDELDEVKPVFNKKNLSSKKI